MGDMDNQNTGNRAGGTGGPSPTSRVAGRRHRIAVIDDDTLIREGIAARIPEFDLVVAAHSLEQFRTLAAGADPIDLVIVDLHLHRPGVRPAPAQGRRVITELVDSGRRCIIYTNERRRLALAGCLAAGAHGLVHKTEPVAALSDAVNTVMAGGFVVTPAVAGLVEVVASAGKLPTLSPRQTQVLKCRARGQSFASVARQLFISERTAEDHMNAVVTKFADFLTTHSPADLERELGIGPGDLLE
jgi:DNA-binding NarL/FixJ family response regulator